MGFEIILNNVQDIHNKNLEYRKAKYNQEGYKFTIHFYDDDTMESPSDGFSEDIGFVLKVGNYIKIQDKDKNFLISIREEKEIYKKIQDEFYLMASVKKSKKRKSKKRKSKKRRTKKRKSRTRRRRR